MSAHWWRGLPLHGAIAGVWVAWGADLLAKQPALGQGAAAQAPADPGAARTTGRGLAPRHGVQTEAPLRA